ncbi:hypothetical protein B795N_17470 [Marinilactibacillus psychrotolerans]|nr:hypothetical protein B795N_17470 [Marinilactibacillus psychrotolerans]
MVDVINPNYTALARNRAMIIEPSNRSVYQEALKDDSPKIMLLVRILHGMDIY